MELRGFTNEKYDRIVKFTLADCPVCIADSQVALFGIEGSSILCLDTITRGIDEIYEGDIIIELSTDKVLGYVIYCKGFYLLTLAGRLKEIPDMKHIKVKKGSKKTTRYVTSFKYRTALLFICNNSCLGIESFLTKVGESIAVVNNKELIHPDDIKFNTGYKNPINKYAIGFGDEYDGGVVTLHNWKVCIQYDTGKRILLEEKIH